MTDLRKAAELALDYIEQALQLHDQQYQRHPSTEKDRQVIVNDLEALRQSLAQSEQEPVAWMDKDSGVVGRLHQWKNAIPLYTAPSKHEWQGLTDDEIYYFVRNAESYLECAKGIEAKLKEKNI